jgi:hypothetical protein
LILFFGFLIVVFIFVVVVADVDEFYQKCDPG